MTKAVSGKLLQFVYASNFFYGLHFALVVYVLSTYIASYIGETYVGLVYASIALISIFFSLNFFRLINWLGHRKLTLILFAVTILSSLALAFSSDAVTAIIFVVIYSVAEFLLLIAFDLAVEKLSNDATTGNIRGVYLTMYNLAFVAGPLITGSIIGNDSYPLMFVTAALILLPSLAICIFGLKGLPEIKPRDHHLRDGLRVLNRNVNIRKIFISTFVLEFFYTWMTIYTPLYLHQYAGFAWSDIGFIFMIMLLPFVFFELPLGVIADRYLGEQEILTAGFIIAAVSTAGLYFLGYTSIVPWAALLFLTRTGASAIEIMNETYFFKQIGPRDAGVIAFFRNARQFNYIVAPIVAIILLQIMPMQGLFLALGIVMLVGAYNASSLQDTEPSRA
ncbi:MAG: MFS transporter [Candidatus Paceibacterota bacterium]|jgi:MFS family permease